MPKTAKTIVEHALGPQRARALWTANYFPALPIAPQSFEIGALLPAMLYMARFGHRRGRGRFVETFGKQRDGTTTASTIATGRCGHPPFARVRQVQPDPGGPGRGGLRELLGSRIGPGSLGSCREFRRWEHVERVVEVDRTPVGRTPRSCPTTYVGLWSPIGKLFGTNAEATYKCLIGRC